MKSFFFFILLLAGSVAYSQKDYFVFIHSENNQAFYLQMGEKTYSSSAAGHLILSRLKDSAYQVTIGFPRSQFPEVDFMIRISRKDHGYLLKNLGNRGWALFDLVSLELMDPLPKKNSLAGTGYNLVKKNDDFARLMSQVVSDTAVMYAVVEPLPKKEEVVVVQKPVSTPVEEKIDMKKSAAPGGTTSSDSSLVVITEPKKLEPVAIEKRAVEESKEENKKSATNIILLEKHDTDSGYYMLVSDQGAKIDVFIPGEKRKSFANPDSTIKKFEKTEDVAVKEKKDEIIYADTTSERIIVRDTVQTKKLVLMNSDCKSVAIDSDVDKLRVRMLSESDVEDRIGMARKTFKSKCFTTAQVKGLTELFKSDQEIYRFLDTAYPFVSDTYNFKLLVSLLTDEYYVKRFRVMVRMD